MTAKSSDKQFKGLSRRSFIQTVGSTVPTLTLITDKGGPQHDQSEASKRIVRSKFTPIDLAPYFNASPKEFGSRERAKQLSGASTEDGLIRTPAGEQDFRGIPFLLGPEGIDEKSWVVLSTTPSRGILRGAEIALQRKANFICFAAFCDWDENESSSGIDLTEKLGRHLDVDVFEKVGQRLGEAVLLHEDGTESSLPLRRRFEVNSPSIVYGHLCFAAEPHLKDIPSRITDSLSHGTLWGYLQFGVWDNHYIGGFKGPREATIWLSAVPNPKPQQTIQTLRLRGTAEDALVVCGLTLFHGRENPLRYGRLNLYRLTLPEAISESQDRWKVEIDLGVVARTYVLPDFAPDEWLSGVAKGLGESSTSGQRSRHLYVEVAASPEATLVLRDARSAREYEFDLSEVVPRQELEARPQGIRVEVLNQEKVWLFGRIVDATTGHPTPVRLGFRTKEGRYIPPYGHRTEINSDFFQDYGGDIQLMDTSFAYVDGTFQVELPVGDVYLEMAKGFEYKAVRQKLTIKPKQRELNLEISRFADLRSEGWATADVHVHCLSPTTAILEAQAEGLNLVNLLAMQLSDLFTNFGDLPRESLMSKDGETMVRIGTENRQHLLGHIGLLGGHGAPVQPLSAGGPHESYFGDPVWSSLAEWADACRERGGLAVGVHFPYPIGEIAADVVLGKLDAVEIYPRFRERFKSLYYLDWYRYLNCGYRLPAVGGTDKVGANVPVGANRTYAYLGQEEFSFSSWAKAVRRGNTFQTSGPLIFFHADGRVPGEDIMLQGRGTVEIRVEAKSSLPIHSLEVISNGRVVALHEQNEGARELVLKEKIRVSGPGWLAARCLSTLGPANSGWPFMVAAHTSPVYVRVPGRELLLDAPTATYMLTLIEGAETWLENLATRPDAERFERARRVFREAREHLHRRLHQQSIQH